MKKLTRILSLFLVLTLTAAALFSFTSCDKRKGDNTEKTITVTVTDNEGKDTVFTITTTASNLRGALEQEDLIEGDESEYGLYVKVVNGIRADYDKDGAYWSFYRDGEMLMTGVDDTIIADGDTYQIKYEKA